MSRPIFIFSLPRTGSTLLQRLLACHPEVATSPESWVLLPALYGLRQAGVYSHLNHRLTVAAIDEALETIASGEETYLRALRAFAQSIYDESAAGAAYFLDKTPRYHVFADQIIRAFPDGRFIFLWRSPLATVSSLCRTWGGGNWNLRRFHIDLYDGLASLIEAADAHEDRVLQVRYEDLVSDPHRVLQTIHGYLELDYNPQSVRELPEVGLGGSFGDPTGVEEFRHVTDATLTRWKDDLGPAHRRRWVRAYLHWIGEDRLRAMGYSKSELEVELAAAARSLGFVQYLRDVLVGVRSGLESRLEPHVFRDKNARKKQGGGRHLLR